jgi:transposase
MGKPHESHDPVPAGRDKRRWLHVACTEYLTLLGLAPSSRAGADTLGVLPGFRGTLVHDSLSFYTGYDACAHQLCGADP